MEEFININFKYTEKGYTEAMRWYYFSSLRIKFDFILAVILPKRAFTTKEVEEQFRKLLSNKLKAE